ncbi:MAG: hypothetical protein ABTQ25_17330 [Nitrosomonas ureae]
MPADFVAIQEVLKKVINILEPLGGDERRYVIRSTAAWFNDTERITTNPPHQDVNIEVEPANLQNFVFLKKTKNDSEAVAVLAYYLEVFRNQKSFKTADLEKLNIEAGTGQKFGNINKTVNNAAQRSYFFAPAGKGFKQLTPLGRMVVKALPDEEKVKQLIEEHKPRAKRKVIKNTT